MRGSVSSVESFGLVDGPGIRVVVFLNGCKLRCKYCHNPENWILKENNMDSQELFDKIMRFEPYFDEKGGVTFSGGEPLLQQDFLIDICQMLKKEDIHIALDTAGVGVGNYENILKYIDLIIFDVKHVDRDGYKDLTGATIDESFEFLKVANRLNKKFWVRQVIVPGMMDNDEYIRRLSTFIKEYIDVSNIEKIEFLPYHTMGKSKYKELGIEYPLGDLEAMDNEKCQDLYRQFMVYYNE